MNDRMNESGNLSPMLNPGWRIDFFGGLRAHRGEQSLVRFRTQKTASLLAYLAFHGSQMHSREVLVDLLWPECDAASGRNSLSAALSALRRDMESDSFTIIQADRFSVGLDFERVSTDVKAFESALKVAESSEGQPRLEALQSAIDLYRGRLLPDLPDEWIISESRRLEEAFFRGLRRLILALKKEGEVAKAIAYAERGVARDPAREEAQRDLVQLYASTGQISAARRQYAELERQLALHDGTPSAASRQIMEEIERRAQILPTSTSPSIAPAVATESQPTPVTESLTPPPLAVAGAAVGRASKTQRLPVQLTRFFGRETEIGRLVEMMSTPGLRLVTLTGHGGSGKTRLSLEVARQLSSSFGGPIHFVALADLQEPQLLPEAILDALQGRDTASMPTTTTSLDKVVEALSTGPAILILDNFEQLVTGGAVLVRSLVEQLPELRVLVTSRRRLGLRGEREFVLLPLPTPRDTENSTPSPQVLCQYVSVQLFLDRASAVRPDFRLTESNASTVAQLCRRLDGIPLAIELAAARSKVLTAQQMLQRLENSLDVIATPLKDVEDRHRSLRATMEWSFDLLSEELRTFWTQLGVFRGGWTLEAAEQVCQEPFALEYLEQLQEASLVLAEEGSDGEMRFRLLETLREYALEQLAPDELAPLEERYATYFECLAHLGAVQLIGPQQGQWLKRLESEQDNFRAVLTYLLEYDPHRVLRLGSDLCPFWETRSNVAEGRSWLERALVKCAGESISDDLLVARAHRAAGWLAYFETEFSTSLRHLEAALALFRSAGDKRGEVEAMACLVITNAFLDNLAPVPGWMADIQSLIHDIEDPQERAAVLPLLSMVGFALAHLAHHKTVAPLLQQVVTQAEELGDIRSIARCVDTLATVAIIDNRLEEASAFLKQALELFAQADDPYYSSHSLWNTANIACLQGDTARAREYFLASAQIIIAMDLKVPFPYLLNGLGRLQYHEQNYPLSVEILAASSALFARRKMPNAGYLIDSTQRALDTARQILGKETFQRHWEKGWRLNPFDAAELGMK